MKNAEKDFQKIVKAMPLPLHEYPKNQTEGIARKFFLAGRKSIDDRRCDKCKHIEVYNQLGYPTFRCLNKPVEKRDSDGEYAVIVESDYYCKYWEEREE